MDCTGTAGQPDIMVLGELLTEEGFDSEPQGSDKGFNEHLHRNLGIPACPFYKNYGHLTDIGTVLPDIVKGLYKKRIP